jgi:hypothetical protein
MSPARSGINDPRKLVFPTYVSDNTRGENYLREVANQATLVPRDASEMKKDLKAQYLTIGGG